MRWKFFALCILAGLHGWAYTPPVVFVANKGQYPGPHFFEAQSGGASLFFDKSAVRIALADGEVLHEARHNRKLDACSLPFHALALDFPGARPGIVPEELETGKAAPHHYIVGQNRTSVLPAASIVYRSLYAGVDLVWKTENNRLKYDFVVAPGASPEVIRLRYTGADQMRLVDGKLELTTSIGKYTDEAPIAYQLDGRDKRFVPCCFVLQNGVLRFELSKGYDRSLPLIIDPTLIFSTYSGAQSDNFGYTACSDESANMYTAGTVFGPNYPVTTGAYQVNFVGNSVDANIQLRIDIGIMKFNTTGTQLLYATFLGGNRIENPHSIVANDLGELYVMGSTNSTNFPTAPFGYDTSHNGGYDIFVSKLSGDGSQLLGGTYYGGSGNDGLNLAPNLRNSFADEFRGDVFLASNGDVLVASMAGSSNLATPGVFQATYAGGTTDGLVLRLSNNLGQRIWATYLGGSAPDALYSVKQGSGGEVVVAGGTASSFTLPGFGYQTSNAGGVDGMVARFEAATGQGISGTFLGSAGYDQLFFIDIDGLGDVYVNGQTDSNIVTTGTNYNDPRSGQYIGCFSPQLGTLRWLGRYGARTGAPELNLSAFVVDLCQNIYVSGWTGNLNGLGFPGPTNFALTNNALQTTSDGYDFYLAAFAPGMLTLQYSTYFGGGTSREHVDGGTSRFDKRGVMYQAICAGCLGNSDLPVTPNAYSTTNGSSNCNNAAIKLAFELESGVRGRFGWTQPSSWCAPLSLQIEDYSRTVSNTSWFWEVSNGDTSTLSNPRFDFPIPGTYTIRLRVSSPVACNGFDTISRTITVVAPPALALPNDSCLCAEDGYVLRANVPGATYQWSGPTSSTEATITPSATGTYSLTLTDANGCTATDSVNLVLITCFGEIPNVITPNGDGVNDRVSLPGTSYNDFLLRVFNRWGQQVFSSNNQARGWGGEFDGGGRVPGGDYVIRMEATFCNDRVVQRDFPIKVLY